MPTFLKSSLLSVVVRVLAVVLAGQCLATVHLGVEHFQQKTPMAQQSQQRAIITFGQTLNLGGPLKALVDLDLISTSTNTKQYIAVEQARDFFVEVREFSVNRGFNPIGLELNTKVGFFALGSDIAAQKNLNGPGASVALKGDTSNISTSFLLLPSYEQYYIKDNTDSQSSTLWSVQAHKRLAIRDSLNAFLFFGYDYFSELGTEAAFRSKLRNNSVRGDIVKAEFVYDYSIFSAVTKLEWQVGRYLVSPYVNIGMNESAFNGENLHSFLGIDLGFAQTTLGVNYVDIQKNALIAIYTDESIDRANVSGWEARAQHKFSDQFRLNFQVSLLDDREINEQIVTTKLSATIWSQL